MHTAHAMYHNHMQTVHIWWLKPRCIRWNEVRQLKFRFPHIIFVLLIYTWHPATCSWQRVTVWIVVFLFLKLYHVHHLSFCYHVWYWVKLNHFIIINKENEISCKLDDCRNQYKAKTKWSTFEMHFHWWKSYKLYQYLIEVCPQGFN